VKHISSDQGWSASTYKKSGLWYVKRALPGWEPCPDGTAADGLQMFRFYPVSSATGAVDRSQSNLFAGIDETTGVSGGCGINTQLVITIPFRLTRIG
jgi:hypothetical protein